MFAKMFAKNECRQIDRLLWDYAAIALCEPDMELVEAHISGCRACAKRVDEYGLVVGVVKTGRIVRMPESRATWQSLRATLEKERRIVPRRERLRFPVLALGSMAIAAILILFVAPRLANDIKVSPGRLDKPIDDVNVNRPAVAVGPGYKMLDEVKRDNLTPDPTVGTQARLVKNDSQHPHRSSARISPRAYDSGIYETSRKPQSSAELAHYVAGEQADRPYDGSPKRDYVLSPVGMGRSQGSGAHFVMGTIPESDGGITTASYTKAVEEAPVW